MPLYEYLCDTCGRAITQQMALERRMEDIGPCDCGGTYVRMFSAPTVHTHKDAADVLNRAAAGEGDPVPGKTRGETRRAAVALARSIKQGKRSH